MVWEAELTLPTPLEVLWWVERFTFYIIILVVLTTNVNTNQGTHYLFGVGLICIKPTPIIFKDNLNSALL